MPVYEYKCSEGHITEQLRDIKARERVVRCSTCNAPASLIFSIPGKPNYGFKPFTTEHITGYPVKVESRTHKKALFSHYGLAEAG